VRQDDSYFSTKPVQATKVMVSVDISRLQGEFGIRDQTWPWVKMDVPIAFNGWYPTQDKLGWMDTQVFVWMDGLPGWLVM
jgi:hypothetical protein